MKIFLFVLATLLTFFISVIMGVITANFISGLTGIHVLGTLTAFFTSFFVSQYLFKLVKEGFSF
jgi:hypothetical protein